MIRPQMGSGFRIIKADIASGMVKVQTYQTMIEYWVYRREEYKSNLKLTPQQIAAFSKNNPTYLYCIIVSKDNDAHRVDRGDSIFVKGVKFDGVDINKYLEKTNRRADKTKER